MRTPSTDQCSSLIATIASTANAYFPYHRKRRGLVRNGLPESMPLQMLEIGLEAALSDLYGTPSRHLQIGD